MAARAAILKIYFFASSPELKGQLTRNLVGSIGVICRSKIAKIMQIVNPSWLPFRVCSDDHAQLTGMPYIFFFKIKNCLNDDLFISCDDRIGKCCITSAYLQWLCHSGERPVARGPLVFLYIYIENFNSLFRNHLTNFSVTLQECFLCNPLSRLFKPS